jgi:hypothetical protein
MHLTELSSTLQTALTKRLIRFGVRCILDPDGLAIDLSDYLDAEQPIQIRKSVSIMPYGEMGRFTISEVTLRLINRDDYFNPDNSASPFYYASTRIIEAKPLAQKWVKVRKNEAAKFSVGGNVTLGSGKNRAGFNISSIDTSDPNFDIINFSSTAGTDYPAGTVLEVSYIPGKRVVLKTVINNESEEITQFVGILKGYPKITAQYAEITLFDPLKNLLETPVRATSVYFYNNSKTSTVKTTLDNDSTGTFDPDYVDVFSNCPIGTWEIEFTSATNYVLTDPYGTETTGHVSTNLYYPEGAPLPQLQIDADAFGGTFVAGDRITFQTTLVLGGPFTSQQTVIAHVKQLMTNSGYGAGLPESLIDTTTLDNLDSFYDEMVGYLTVTRPESVLKVCEMLQQQINGWLFTRNNGLISLFIYRPKDPDATYPTLSPTADIREVDMSDLGRIEAIVAEWHYSHSDRRFLRTLYVPDEESAGGAVVNIKLPAAYSEAVARSAAERLWVFWRRGIRVYQIKEKFNYGLAWELGDIFNISSNIPSIGNKTVVIFELNKDLRNAEVTALAFDLNFAFENFLILDVGHKLDTGKVIW